MKTLIKFNYRKWSWVAASHEVVEKWFDRMDDYSKNHVVKYNAVRRVFRIDEELYIKHDSPTDFIKKILALFSSKAKSEFESYLLLDQLNIPSVKYLGWGKCGSQGILITEAFPESVSFLDYWNDNLANAQYEVQSLMIKKLIDLINKLAESNIFHPDFHLGNLLVNCKNNEIALVDLYGIKQVKNLKRSDIQKLSQVLVFLRMHLSKSQILPLLGDLSTLFDVDDPCIFWDQLLIQEDAKVEKSWIKRREQVLNHYDKYCSLFFIDGSEYVLTHCMKKKPYVDTDKIVDILSSDKYEAISGKDMKEAWLKNFYLRLKAINHREVIALKIDKNEHTIYLEKVEVIPFEEVEADEFTSYCKTLNITVNRDNIIKSTSGMMIDYISEL